MKTIKIAFMTGLIFSTAVFGQTFDTVEGDFKGLFNSYRVGQPKITPWAGSYFPYGDGGTALKLDADGDPRSNGRSPMQVYAKIMGLDNDVHDWEAENHSCKGHTGKMKESCESWWGHCNGWAAAAIKEKEPKKTVVVKGNKLSVGDQKGILTELWLSSYSINAGITEKGKKTGNWVHDHKNPEKEMYQSFWDVSPKAFFMIFTKQVGHMKTGVVIDRFTGDEVWNQPIVGYRFMPIKASNIKKVTANGSTYWSVRMGVKFFWANDSGIGPSHISKPFNINTMTKDETGLDPVLGAVESIAEDYEGRYLEFSLNFDDEVRVSEDGTKVLKSGDFLGEGTWYHHEHSKKFSYDDLNSSHPDFIWLPTNPYQDNSGYGNPYMKASIARMIAQASEGSSTGGNDGTSEVRNKMLSMVFRASSFRTTSLNASYVKSVVKKVLMRDGIRSSIREDGISIRGQSVTVKVTFYQEEDLNQLQGLFSAAKLPFKAVE